MKKLQAGTVCTLKVERETEFGYFLSNGIEDVLLHKSDVNMEISLEDEVTVFLYQDHQGRLAATMTIPDISFDKYCWVKVVDVHPKLGVFVDIGISKDLLVSKDDLPPITDIWPDVGDLLYCTLKLDKAGRLFGKIATTDILQSIAIKADRNMFNRNIQGRIYRLLKVGSFLITNEGYLGFIHESQRRREPRLGQLVEGRVIDVKEDGTINVSLLPRRYESIGDDAEAIYSYMEGRGGAMPYWDKSDAEDIKMRFNMSKSAFKRALGKLMKEGKVYQEEGWTYFKKQ